MDNITISKDQFDNAVAEVATELTSSHLDQAAGALLFNLSGMAFAARLRHKLFDKQEEN